jgi:pimeloyl-ACP methyl ester carboxylesterase
MTIKKYPKSSWRYPSDEELVQLLPGFTNRYANVNGIRLHYVEGGHGDPLILLPEWPETWWAYYKAMPLLAPEFHVIVVDMTDSESDKKTRIKNVLALIKKLGYDKVHIGVHDIGAPIAFSIASDFPEVTSKVIILATPFPDLGMYHPPNLPKTPRTDFVDN